jgi:hypothetical protein
MPAQRAYDDLLQRSLARIPGDLARLIYLASTRDYNTGTYHHEGLASRFRTENAAKALEMAHKEIFYKVSAYSLEELVAELGNYLNAPGQNRAEVLRMWQKLEPYRVAIPMGANTVVARFFLSNLRLALAILRQRQELVVPEDRLVS